MEEAEGGEEVTEMWYQLPAEEDGSTFFPTLSETGMGGEQTSFPSMEEGTIQSEADLQSRIPGGRTLPLQLDFQDSRLSPCLPLLTSGSIPGHKFFEDTLFQQTETEFASLRASLDMSEFPGPGSMSLQMTDALRLASKEVLMVQEEDTLSSTQHYQEKSPDGHLDLSSPDGHLDLSSDQYLSEHPLNVSHGDKEDDTITENVHSDSGVLKTMGQPSVEDLMAEDGAFLGSNVPAPVLLELLEKEVGLSAGSGSSSRRSSQTVSTSEADNIDVLSQEPREDKVGILEAQVRTKTPTGLNLEEETFRDSSEIHFDDPELEKANLSVPGHLDQSGITLRQSSPGLRDELQKQLCVEIQQERKKREMSKFHKSRIDSSPSSQNALDFPENVTKPSYSGEDTVEEQLRGEFTRSSHCIERGHKETDLSQAVNTPIDEASFIGRLAYPISQSTPGTFSMNRKQLSGRIQQIKAKLTGSDMSLNEEPNSSSSNPNVASSGVHQSVQSSQGYPESSDSQRSPSPQRKKIQSLPSLNYIEKVGSWNTNQSFDTLVLRGLTGVSPKKLAYNAVADSLNRMLSKQTDSSTSKKGLDASIKGTSSMTNLNVEHIESSSASKLTRSQSYNSVITAVGGNQALKRTEENIEPVAEEGEEAAKLSTVQPFESLRTHSILSRDISGNETKHPNKGASMGKNDTAHSPPDYVEHLEKSNHEREKRLDESSRPLNTSLIMMEHFSDVSLDQEFSGSSHTSDHVGDVLQDSVGSSVLGMSHHQGEPLMQVWSGEGATREKEWSGEGATREKEWSGEGATREKEWSGEGATREKEWTGEGATREKEWSGEGATREKEWSGEGATREKEWSGEGATREKEWTGEGATRENEWSGEGATPEEWSGEEATPENEFNIEERIPTYLRNLGINQSPTTILMPFNPKGPIREPEFSPSDLRTIKSSNATPNRSMRLSEGESQNGANISQSSLYSTTSTTSVSIPMGSEVGPGSPLPTERSPQFSSRSTNDRPISQDDTATRGISGNQEVYSVQELDSERRQGSPDAEELNELGATRQVLHDIQEVAEDSTRVEQVIEQFESAGPEVGQANLEHLNLGSLSSSWKNPHHMDSTNDSFVGSKTLKEIRKLLEEADDVNLDRTTPDFNPKSSLRDPSITSPAMSQSLRDSLKSGASNSRSASPLDLQLNNLSWDTSFNSSVTSDNLLYNRSSAKADWNWKDPIAGFSPVGDGFYLKDISKDGLHLHAPFSLHKHGRSEPEGSSEATAIRMAPASVHLQDSRARRTVNLREGLRSEQLLSSVTRAVGGLKQVLDVTGSSNLRSTGEESNASSGDTLAAQVKSLLKNGKVRSTGEESDASSGDSLAGQVKSLLKSGKLRSTGEESDASSGDSLAARVKSLLKSNTLSSTSKVRQTAEDENQRSRGSVKLKLAGQPTPTDGDLSEEDRRRIEEIKRELLDHAKGAEKSRQHSTFEPGPSRGSEQFRLQLTPSPQLDQYHVTDAQDSSEDHIIPLPASTRCGSSDVHPSSMTVGNIKAVATVTLQSDEPTLISSQLQQGLIPDLHTPLTDRSASDLDKKTAYANKYGEEATKPIASITFSSRKRSSPLPTSTRLETAELSSATRDFDYAKSLADPYDKDRPRADPYDKDRSCADPYDKDRSHADPYDKGRSSADPYDKGRSGADPYDKGRSGADPYDKGRSGADPYDKGRSGADPYDKGRSGADPYDKGRSGADPYDKGRSGADLYDKGRSGADPYDKGRSGADPYDKGRSGADPYDKGRSGADPYDKGRSGADPYDKGRSGADPYDKGRSGADPYDKGRSGADPYDKGRSGADPYDKGRSGADPYDKGRSGADPYDKGRSGADPYDKGRSGADPYDKGRSGADPYDKGRSGADPYDKGRSGADPYDKGRSGADPYDKGRSGADPYDKGRSGADPYDKGRSGADPYDKGRSGADPYDKGRSGADPYDKGRSGADPYDKGRSGADPYDKGRSGADPYDKGRSGADPYDKGRSGADPYDKGRSGADPYDKGRSGADPYDKGRSGADPYDKGRSRADPYDKGRSRADPYDKGRSRADPYDKDRSRADPYDKDRSRADPYDKDRSRADPYDKDRSRADPYDKDRSRADPYDKDRSRADPYDKDGSRADPYDKDGSRADPYDKNGSRADPYDKDGSRADPYYQDGSHADSYYQDKLHADPYYSYKPRADPYDKDKSQADPYYKDKPGADPHDKGRPRVDPYYKDGPPADQYDKDGPPADQYDKDGPPADQYDKDGPPADQYDKDKSQADPYYKEKPCADPYEKEKPHVDPKYKEKQLADLLYKDHRPSETSRSNFIQCPSPMHNMMPQNPTILNLTDNGGVPSQSKTVVSEHRGQSEEFKNHIQPDPSSMVVRNSSMNEDSFVPPVARPSKPIGLQEDIAGPSHSALVAGRPMIELPPQILNVSTKEWKIYPEPIFSAKIQRDGTHEFPSQELKTEPTSPTRKALSCIRVTISPKEDLNISSVMMATGTGDDAQTFRSSSAMAKNGHVSSHGLASVPGSPYFLHSPPSASQGEGRSNSEGNVHMEDKENIPDKTATKKQRQVPLYDATTQITTESPEKTTFSAEIYIDGSLKEASCSTVVQTQKTPEGRSRTPFFSISRATDQPLLLPYRPPGSPELFYTPAMNGGSRMSPVSTIESSHPGSNDAVSPKFPAEVLGSAAEKISDTSIPHHSDGIYSKDQSPKTAWEERATEKRKTPVIGPFHDDNKASYCSLQHKVSRPEPASKDFQRERRDPRSAREDEEFFPLKPEVDYAPAQQSSMGSLKKTGHHDITDYPRRRDQQEQTRGTPLHSPNGTWDFKVGVREKHVRYEDHSFSSEQPTNPTKSFQKTESTLSQSAISNHTLDDLWARYTDRRRSHLSESNNNLEVSLVERLDRLARLLQNPKPYLATKDDKDGEQVLQVNKKDHEKSRETKKEEREKWYLRKFGVDARPVNGTSENQDGSVSRLSESASSERVLHGDSYSDFSSEVRSIATEESAGGSEAATQTDSASTFTTNSTISTIDTVRLINAFGPERVRPSSKLSRLYNTIDLQKKRSEGTSKKASRLSASRGHSTMEIKDLHKSLNKMADTDSVSSSSSWEPLMRSKKGCKVLNKGIQTGDLEIVTSATKRHTRDVGTTFPSPGGEMLKPSAEREMPAHSGSGVRRPKTKQYIPPGLSWFVPADGTKCDSPKENKLNGPGPAWYESTTNAKPWREPLRERNQQGPAIRRGESLNVGSEPGKDNKIVQPFVRATLQELLKAHRPDFIFQSGERVKRLQLLTKERKLQDIFQSEREALFNQPERRGRHPYHTSYKESRTSQKMKNIPRGEMVQRSKRIYEQLPEIKKRKEEEKRRSEYETYRLKAQLFRKKVTNHILGRKTPWN